jgi:hypothetical protein
MKSYGGAGASQRNYIAERWEHDASVCLEMNLLNNSYYLFATHNDYKYIQCGIKKQGIMKYNDNVLKEENTTLHFPSFKNGDGNRKLRAIIPSNSSLSEWELHTCEVMRWNEIYQRAFKY